MYYVSHCEQRLYRGREAELRLRYAHLLQSYRGEGAHAELPRFQARRYTYWCFWPCYVQDSRGRRLQTRPAGTNEGMPFDDECFACLPQVVQTKEISSCR